MPLTFALCQQHGEAPARLCGQVQPSAVEATDVVRDGVVHCRTRVRGGLLPREGTERLTKDIGLRLPARAGQTVHEPLGLGIEAEAQSHAIHSYYDGLRRETTTGAASASGYQGNLGAIGRPGSAAYSSTVTVSAICRRARTGLPTRTLGVEGALTGPWLQEIGMPGSAPGKPGAESESACTWRTCDLSPRPGRCYSRRCNRRRGNGDPTLPRPAAPDGRLLAGGEPPLRRADLPVRQSAPPDPSQPRPREAATPRPLGYDAGAELHLRAPEPRRQGARSRHDLHCRAGTRRARAGREHLPGGNVRRALSRHLAG